MRVLRGPVLPARGRTLRGHPGVRPQGHRAAADHGLRRHPVREVHERGLRLPRPRPRSTFRLGPLTVTADRVRHPVETYGFRVEHDGRALVYSGDTGPCDALCDLARGADLFLCEASFTDGKEDIPELHLNGRQAGECARDAGAGRLVLTHIPPWTDPQHNLRDARAAFGGPVEMARPGAVYEI
ncbi:MBL fold metallo-hydrolase [Streptomyces radiopugnans]|nr:MBL fold metallo-hydrolase [Streptomyces radiopugnans]